MTKGFEGTSPPDARDRPPASERSPARSRSVPPRRKPFTLWRIFLVLVALGALYTAWQTVSIWRYGFRDDGRSADCAIVLGTAAWHNKPSPVLEERLNHAIKLYKDGRIDAIVLTGGYGEGAPYSESQVARKYCVEQGVPGEDLYLENKSQTTVENITEAKKVMEAEGLQTALVVSDPWHLKRAVLIARRNGIDASQSGTTTSRFKSFKARASFLLREFYLYHAYLFFGR